MFHLKSCVTCPCYWVRDSRHFSNILVFNNVLVVTMVIHILLDICLQTKSVRLLCQSHSLAPQRQSSVMPHIHHPSRCGHWRFCCEQPASVMWQSRNSSNQCPPRTHAHTHPHKCTDLHSRTHATPPVMLFSNKLRSVEQSLYAATASSKTDRSAHLTQRVDVSIAFSLNFTPTSSLITT